MPVGTTARRKTKSARGADTVFGYLIPLFFMLLAGYQQVTSGAIDKYVIGALLIFGLGALGWRLDVLFDKYIQARAGMLEQQGASVSNADNKPTASPTDEEA